MSPLARLCRTRGCTTIILTGTRCPRCRSIARTRRPSPASPPSPGRTARTAIYNDPRWRRYRARQKAERGVVERYGYVLSTPAVAAEVEARAVLGSDFDRFDAAVRRYVLSVDVAEHARAVWEGEGRPIRDKFANGMAGVSPYLKAWEQLAAQAMRFAGELGLTPASQKRINGVRGAGRPMGAASAADRKAPPILTLARDAAVNRSRGHVVE